MIYVMPKAITCGRVVGHTQRDGGRFHPEIYIRRTAELYRRDKLGGDYAN